MEQVGVVADALQEALVQDYDGLIRLAPATPPGWNFDGSVYVRGKTRVDVQVREGRVTTAVIEAGTTQSIRIRNPWPGEAVDVVCGRTMAKIVSGATSPVITFRGMAGTRYLLERHEDPVADKSFVPVTGVQAVAAKRLGKVQMVSSLQANFLEAMFVDRWSRSELRSQKAPGAPLAQTATGHRSSRRG